MSKKDKTVAAEEVEASEASIKDKKKKEKKDRQVAVGEEEEARETVTKDKKKDKKEKKDKKRKSEDGMAEAIDQLVEEAKASQPSAAVPEVKSNGFDANLSALFASSAGPVQIPVKPNPASRTRTTTSRLRPTLPVGASTNDADISSAGSSDDSEPDEGDDIDLPPKKRRRTEEDDDLEGRYLTELAREEAAEQARSAAERAHSNQQDQDVTIDDGASDSSASNDLADITDTESLDDDNPIKPDPSIPTHESLTRPTTTDPSKTARTVFLGNISTLALKSKSAKRLLIKHVQSALLASTNPPEKIESIRFRSTAYTASSGPKRAAAAKKDLMDETTQSTNAYVVLSSEAAARRVTSKLNGTVVLDRHMQTDNLGSPRAQDPKRCVFVGNLSFTDEITNPTANPNSSTPESDAQKPARKPKIPADTEEGLYTAFSKCGTIESVRVVRDKETRVSKGFAYVQFTDSNAVEAALGLDGKKFPPMLPRTLRVVRAKGEKRKRTDRGVRNGVRRVVAGKGGRSEAVSGGGGKDRRDRNGVVFEGHRATAPVKSKGKGKDKKKGKPENRSARRGAAFKAAGSKRRSEKTV